MEAVAVVAPQLPIRGLLVTEEPSCTEEPATESHVAGVGRAALVRMGLKLIGQASSILGSIGWGAEHGLHACMLPPAPALAIC